MGAQIDCCHGSRNELPTDALKTIDEFYDPFSELRSKVITDKAIV